MLSFYDYKLPNSKKWLLTNQFLTTFKEELDKIFNTSEKEGVPNYWNTYNWLEGSSGFYKALKVASKKHNVEKAIYEYACNLPWYKSDCFDGDLTILMYKRGIIEEGSVDEINYEESEEELIEMEKNGEIEWVETARQYEGYHVINRDWKYVKKD